MKKYSKRNAPPVPEEEEEDEVEVLSDEYLDDEDGDEEEEKAPILQDTKIRPKMSSAVATNIQRCLVLGTRSISKKDRHLIHDLYDIMPHSRGHNKVKVHEGLGTVMTELSEMHNCNMSLLLDGGKKGTTMWAAQYPDGPSAEFLLRSVSTTAELKMTGNCLKYSRPVLHFDYEFSVHPHLRIMQTLLTMVFGTPKNHAKSKPFFDHMISFFFYDNHIWFRHYQIATDGGKRDLIEIGPRFVMFPLMVFDGYYGGPVLWKNPVPPPIGLSGHLRDQKADAYRLRQEAKQRRITLDNTLPPLPEDDPLKHIFQ
eukprot:PhF_6_TR35033/c0_g1_i1/m.51049/K14820/BRX1, BRIX1; ribosome biogenesis protein BRX1